MRNWLRNKIANADSPNQGRLRQLLARIGNTDREIFRFNRSTVASGMAIGAFWAWMPLPIQTLGAVVTAIRFKSNVAVSTIGVWISNPITMIPMIFFAYRLGLHLTGGDASPHRFPSDPHMIGEFIKHAWPALSLGCLVLGTLSAGMAYVAVQSLWAITHYRRREKHRIFKRGLLKRKKSSDKQAPE